jgi:hypothetical protein
MKNLFKIFCGLLLMVAISSCEDEFEGEIVRDNQPEIPVTFEGATTSGFSPYYAVSYTNGNFSITLRIPENSPLRIKEVTNVVAGATSINAASLTDAASIQYLNAPVTVDGYTYTLTSSITEFNTKVATAARVTTAPAAGAFTERSFMFLLTMEDDSIIVPVQVRLRIQP